MKKSKKIIISVLIPVLLVLLFFSVTASVVFVSLRPVTSFKDEYSQRIVLPKGTSVHEIARELEAKKLIRSEKFFYMAVRFPFLLGRSSVPVLKSGAYTIKSSMAVKEIVDLLELGSHDFVKTVFPEGLTISKIAAILAESGVCSEVDFVDAAHSKKLLEQYEIPAETFEGFLFPDTYFFTSGMDAEEVIKMMVSNFFKHLEDIPSLANVNISEMYRTLVLASIIEREYRVESEAPLIASVFVNRINSGIGLYSCATIEYILTEIQGKPHPDIITYDDLKIDNPYNTYKWSDLPPGPISNPGMVALRAAAEPAKTDYFYFTLTNAASGEHTFNHSLSSHIKAGIQFKTKKAAGQK